MKVGDYVRTNVDILRVSKIYERADGNPVFEDEKGYQWYFTAIKKSNPNIKNLIDVGDYINGSKLLSIDYAEDEYGNCDKLHFYYSFEDNEKDVNEYYEELKIKSIVTKEQFESIEYKIGNAKWIA